MIKSPCEISWRFKDIDGYPIINKDGHHKESRFIYSKTHNNYKFNPEDRVLHTCDNPGCIEPTHLILGTQQDNVADMVSKNRIGDKKGVKNGNHRLTQEQVDTIREMFNSNLMTKNELAKDFKVSHTMICYIINNKNWIN